MSMLYVSGCETGECARTTHPVPGGGVLSGTPAQRGELSAGHRLQRTHHRGPGAQGHGGHGHHAGRRRVSYLTISLLCIYCISTTMRFLAGVRNKTSILMISLLASPTGVLDPEVGLLFKDFITYRISRTHHPLYSSPQPQLR